MYTYIALLEHSGFKTCFFYSSTGRLHDLESPIKSFLAKTLDQTCILSSCPPPSVSRGRGPQENK